MRFRGLLLMTLLLGIGIPGAFALGQAVHTPNILKLTKKENAAKARIGEVAWLAGRWIGEFSGGTGEEVFAPPAGDSMLGMFRLVKDGRIVFSELITIVEEEGSLVLKHFDRNLKGWEEKDVVREFPLIRLTEREAYFDSITYQREGDEMRFFVAVRQKNGELQELAGRHRQAALP